MPELDLSTVHETVRTIVASQPARERTYLLEILHAVQDAFGHVPIEAAEAIRREIGVPVADVYTLVTFYDLLTSHPTGAQTVHLCEDLVCQMHGADALAALLTEIVGTEGEVRGDGWISWHRCSCLGLCDKAPAALVGHSAQAPVSDASLRELASQHHE